MAIRDVVTRGYGNGTYSPGVNRVPTRGYSIGATIGASGCWAAGEVFLPGFQAGEVFLPGFQAGESYLPGFQAGQEVC